MTASIRRAAARALVASALTATTLSAPLIASSAAAQGVVVVTETFDKASNRWQTGAYASGEARVLSGELNVRVMTGDGGSIFAIYDRQFIDSVIEVDVRLRGGTDDNWQLISCRRVDNFNYNALGVSADGYAIISVWNDGQRVETTGPIRSDRVLLGPNQVNRVQAECIGPMLRLTVNGEVVAELNDPYQRQGAAGLGASSLAGVFTEVAFDNFVIRNP